MEQRPWLQHYDYNVPTRIRYPRITVQDLIQIPANSYPDKPAINYYGTEITFLELRRQVLRMANALGALGIGKGERVAIHLPPCPQYAIAYYATLHLGAIVVNCNPMYTADELRLIIETTGVKALVTHDTVLPTVHRLTEDSEIPIVIVARMDDFTGKKSAPAGGDYEGGWHPFTTLLEGCSDTRVPRIPVHPDDPAMIMFTGGTTGIPKGAIISHANVIAATFQITQWLAPIFQLVPPEKRVVLGVLPFFHVYGNIVVMNAAMINCNTQILFPQFDIDELMEEVLPRLDTITHFPAVPTMINAIINHPRVHELDLGRKLGILTSGAAPMPVELIEQLRDMGIFYVEGWGMTETTGTGCCNPLLGQSKWGSIGLPLPDTDIRLVDPQEGDKDVPAGEPGEILIRGPQVMGGYWNRPEETASELRDGWLVTGDIAVRDEDNYLFIVDRKKDMIIAGGYNIYPRDIDEVLFQHPKVADAIAVGIPDAYRGETVKAYVVLKEGETATEKEIIGFCREKLAAYKAPKLVEFREELPKSAVGKVLRRMLRDEEAAKLS